MTKLNHNDENLWFRLSSCFSFVATNTMTRISIFFFLLQQLFKQIGTWSSYSGFVWLPLHTGNLRAVDQREDIDDSDQSQYSHHRLRRSTTSPCAAGRLASLAGAELRITTIVVSNRKKALHFSFYLKWQRKQNRRPWLSIVLVFAQWFCWF